MLFILYNELRLGVVSKRRRDVIMIFLSVFGSQHCFKILKFMIVYSELKTAYVSAVSGGHYEKDRVSDAKFISAKNNIGPKMCVNYCLMLSTCNALNYFHSELKCECLLEVNPEMNLRYNKGSYFTKIHNWIRVCHVITLVFIKNSTYR